MASRLYRTTRPLYLQVTRALDRLGIATIGSPTTAALIALYVTGLILLDARPTQTRLARFLPGRCHDALNRLLRTSPLSTRSLLGLLVAWVARSGVPGYLCLDDVVVEKAFAKRLRWAGWTYSFAKKRKVYGMHVVVVLWCSADGGFRIPVAFRLWRPKRSCAPGAYQTKLQLAAQLLTELVAARLPFQYLVMDIHYTAGWFTRLAGRLGICWVGALPPKTTVIWRGRRQSAAELAERSTAVTRWIVWCWLDSAADPSGTNSAQEYPMDVVHRSTDLAVGQGPGVLSKCTRCPVRLTRRSGSLTWPTRVASCS